jgi:kinesin family protein C2/C3
MNANSSRSHLVMYIVIHIFNKQTHSKIVSKICLVDLAGSERIAKSGVEGKGLKEAQHINKSLSSLGDVISSLKQKGKHTPYRNSTLTFLLQDSLGGKAKTLMFANVSPMSGDYSETISTLEFANRTRGITLGKAKKNVSAA